jgi:hypothetical protein
MGLVGLVLIPRWVPIDASEGTVRGLVLTIGSIFGAGLPFLLTMRDETGATQMRRTVIAFGRGAGIAAVAASALLWSGQTERWVVIGVGFPIGFVATGTMLSLRIGGTDTIA